MKGPSRRDLLLAGAALCVDRGVMSMPEPKQPYFKTRGVVIYPEDLSLRDWPERAAKAGLTTIALHHGSAPSHVMRFVQSDAGQQFLESCRKLGLEVEYELHAMRELLPRALFEKDPSLFRMNDKGGRVPDANLCVCSRAALDAVAQSALRISEVLRPTTGRHFLWGDDGAEWCRCPKCRELGDSDQALLLNNHLVGVLRKDNPKASLAHLSYANTILPPSKVKPKKGVFLEFAPIHRRYDVPYDQQLQEKDGLNALEANLKVFPAETAQALEYWLDMSRFSGWRRPVPKIPWMKGVFLEDLKAYAKRGVRHVTSFAAWIDAEYLKVHGDLGFLEEYGNGLKNVGS
ncbi:MAG: DUF4838 domain-containing protein [Armatimonadetes bacterium]|nr:DUF4838 domain-containing protein [Armatimonadota bacterium]